MLLLISSAMFSCVTTSVMRIRPIEQESVMDGGKEIVKQEKEGVKVVASYDGRYEQYAVFYVFLNGLSPLFSISNSVLGWNHHLGCNSLIGPNVFTTGQLVIEATFVPR